jgi:hypothetical protein
VVHTNAQRSVADGGDRSPETKAVTGYSTPTGRCARFPAFGFSEDSLFGCSLVVDGRKRAGSVLGYACRFWQLARVCRVKLIGNLFL